MTSCFGLAIALLTATAATAGPAQPPLRLATYAYPAFDRRAALASLASLVEARTGRPVTVQLLPTPDALATAVRRGDVDLAVTNLAVFTQVARLPAARAIVVLAPPPATLERYRGVLLARRAGGPTTLADLRRMAPSLHYIEVLPGSTSGAMVQAKALREAGIAANRFRETSPAGTHDAALAAVIDGTADVAALAEGPWLALLASAPERASRLVPLWRSAPLPPGPIVCIASASVQCRRIAAALLSHSKASEDAARMLARGWSETAGARRFIPVRTARYAAFIPPPSR